MDQVHLYLIKCSRRIWGLIPDIGSRKGIEAAENYLNGIITQEEAYKADWPSEASAFLFDYSDASDKKINLYTNTVISNISKYESILVPPQEIKPETVQSLLKNAAYFANMVLCFRKVRFGRNHKSTMEKYGIFMPVDLFLDSVSSELYEAVL